MAPESPPPDRPTGKRGQGERSAPRRASKPRKASQQHSEPVDEVRLLTARALGEVLSGKQRLDVATDALRARLDDARDSAFARELLSGTVRYAIRLRFVLGKLLSRPLSDPQLELPLLLGLYQLGYTRVAPHAAVNTSVNLAVRLGYGSARGLVNGVLRRFQREATELSAAADADPAAQHAHPLWLVEALREAYPQDWQQVLQQNNARAPLSLRVNTRKLTRGDYLQLLREAGLEAEPIQATPQGVALSARLDPRKLPGYVDGAFSVQDGAAQLASELLDAADGARVLDACAAPGGKSAAILERAPGVTLTAVDQDARRMRRIEENLARLGLHAELRAADATHAPEWADTEGYTHILADVPCSATGIIRRHPDIKLRREAGDLQRFAETQTRLLESLWQVLRAGGTLLYATCSLMPAENQDVVRAFLDAHADARESTPASQWRLTHAPGMQILPGTQDMDGFYYARLTKS